MHKKLTLAILFSLVTLASFGYSRYQRESCPKFYLGFSTGFDNPVGLIGVNFDIPVTGRFSLGTGMGLSLWGYKTFGEARLYFKDCNRGWALGAGATYSTGIQDVPSDMPTTIGTTEVLMDLKSATTAMLSGYRFFSLGSRHRMHLQLGWAQPINDKPWVVKSGHILTTAGNDAMKSLSPGGLILGFGFTFGIGG